MKPENERNSLPVLLRSSLHRCLTLIHSHPSIQNYHLERLYVRNAYAEFPTLQRTMLIWWIDGLLLVSAICLLMPHISVSPAVLFALLIVWFCASFNLAAMDQQAMQTYRERYERSRFARAYAALNSRR